MDLSALQLIHQDSVSSLYYDAALPGSYIVWHGFASSADFRATCLRSVELMREKRFCKSISDARNLRVISLADQKWVTEVFLPLVVKLNISPRFYSGMIVPQDFFGRQSLETVTEQAHDVIAAQYQDLQTVRRYFDNADAAREWLLTVDAADRAEDAGSQQAMPAHADETAPAQAA